MKLLFLTQVLDRDDGVLGFCVRWIEEFAAHADAVRVVALEVGNTGGLPANVDWVEIGRKGRVGRYLKYRSTLRTAFAEGFDVVLAHMVPRYALVAARPSARAGARLYLWYTHKGVDARLRRAVTLVQKTFTASDESLRVDTPTRVVTGHGIDTDHFDLPPVDWSKPAQVLSVGRLTPKKDPLTLIRALAEVRSGGTSGGTSGSRDVRVDWVGGGLTTADVGFADEVRAAIAEAGVEDTFVLRGEVPYSAVQGYFESASVLVNASFTGSVDKVVLEAMAARRAVLSCNESFPPIFAELDDADAFGERAALGRSAWLTFAKGDPADLAAKLDALLGQGPEVLAQLGEDLRTIVVRDHGVAQLCERLIREMEA